MNTLKAEQKAVCSNKSKEQKHENIYNTSLANSQAAYSCIQEKLLLEHNSWVPFLI